MFDIELLRLITMVVQLFGTFAKLKQKAECSNTYEDVNYTLRNYVVPQTILDTIILGMSLALIKLNPESHGQLIVFVLVFISFMLGVLETAEWSKRSKDLYHKEMKEKLEKEN